MSSLQKKSKNQIRITPFWVFVKKNYSSIIMMLLLGVLLISPQAKSLFMRQLLATGFFNASINESYNNTSPYALNDFNFQDERGIIENTASLRGKVIFINFWASWCPPCRAEFPSIEQLYKSFKNNPDIFFLMINQDSDLQKAKAYLQDGNYTTPMFTTTGHIPQEIYTGKLPTTLILDKSGKVRFHHTGLAQYASDKFNNQLQQLIAE